MKTFNAVYPQSEYLTQSEAARLLGVSRQAIGRAIRDRRLAIIICNAELRVHRPDVLALKTSPRAKAKAAV